jgi:hypothetical protein
MIPTFDDGPFAGLPYDAPRPLTTTESQRLEDGTEIRLCNVGRPKEPWVLQAVHENKVLWSRVLSASPDPSVEKAELRSKPQRIGPYGWKVFLTVKWSQGVETCYLYLDAKGRFLFYYLTW